MINYTIWKLSKFNSLENFTELLKANSTFVDISSKNRGQIELARTVYNEDSNIGEIKEQSIDGVLIKYTYFTANAQKCKKNDITNLYEAVDYEENVIVYAFGGALFMVVLASLTNATTIIKKIFNNTELWGEILPYEYMDEDILYWLFYRLREHSEECILQNPVLALNGIVSYLGRTEDNRNVVRGLGIRVSALLGTLGMLIGEENLRALRPMIQYNDHEMNVELVVGNAGRIYEQRYVGELALDFENDKQQSSVTLVLFVCCCVIPALLEGYHKDLSRGKWSLLIKYQFLSSTGNEMIYKVKSQLTKIEKEIQLNDELNDIEDEYADDEEFKDLEDEIDN